MTANPSNKGIASALKRLLLSKHRILSLYLANLVMAWIATAGLSAQLGAITNTSLYSDRLVRGFDLGALAELLVKPEVSLKSQTPVALFTSLIFVGLQIFVTGGILAEFLAGEPLSRGRFFERCGENVWKMVRLAFMFVIVAGLLAAILHAIRSAVGTATEDAANQQGAFALQCVILLIEALVLVWVRMWFDLAQAHTVAAGARPVRSAIPYGFAAARRAPRLFGSYLLLGIAMALVLGGGGRLWWHITPPAQVIVSFVILQGILFCLLGIRWWQKALVTAWYSTKIVRPTDLEDAQASVVAESAPQSSERLSNLHNGVLPDESAAE